MSRLRALAAALAVVALQLGLLELGVLWRAAAAVRAHPGEIDVLRALAWPVAAVAGVAVFLALDPRPKRPAPPPPVSPAPDWLRGVLDGMSEGVVAFDARGRVVFANPAAVRLLGRKDLPEGTPMVAFSDVPRLRSTVVRALRGEPVSREIEVPGPPRRSAVLRATPTAHGAVAVLLDVSDVRRMERSWRDFAANVSHELRTPAAAVLVNLEALLESAEDPEPVRRAFAEASLRQARRLADLISDLLDLVRIESGQAGLSFEPLMLDEVLRRAVDDHVQAHPSASGAVTVEVPPDAEVLADPAAVRQVFANLLSNATRYAPGPVKIVARPRGGSVRIEVRDEGPGIAPEHQQHLFERFYRVDAGRSRDAGGTGLGLSIVRELVDTLGGRVGVEANTPTGSVFWVELPRADATDPGVDAFDQRTDGSRSDRATSDSR